MIDTRPRKIYRDIIARKARTALVAISIFIGVMGVVALFSMGEIVVDRLEHTIQQDRLAMTRAHVSLASRADADNAATLESLRQLPDVTVVQGLALNAAYWKLPGADSFAEARLFAWSQPFDALLLEPVDLVDGRFPAAGQGEIAVERRFAAAHGVTIGDELVLRVLGGADGGIDVHEETFTIVGTVYQPYQYPTSPGQPSFIQGDSMLFSAFEDAASIAGSPGFTTIQMRYTDYPTAEASVAQLESLLADESPYLPERTITEDPAKNAFIEQSRSFSSVLAMLAVVALIVAGFLVLQRD